LDILSVHCNIACSHTSFRSSRIHISFKADSISDGLVLDGYHWEATSPVAVVSLVHGFGEHCGRYEKLASHLNANGISVVGVDLRGHGKTESLRGVAKTYSDIHGDLKTLIGKTESLYPTLPHFLFGHSMGGGLVLHHGLSSTDDFLAGYLVSAPLIRLKRHVPWIVRKAVKTIRPWRPHSTFPIPVSGVNISTIPEEQDRYDNDPLNHNRLGFGLAVGMIEAGENVLRNASQWNKPLRLWHSTADRITHFEATKQFAEKANQCEFTVLEKVQHEMHQDVSRDQVHSLMTEFIL
jgi:alpha-beta hydrolase superfamily lysophospholipase